MEQYNNFNSVMETRNYFRNGASLKSHMSRKTIIMNKIFIGSIVGIFMSLFTANTFGQISQGGIPYSLQIRSDETVANERKGILSREIPTLEMPAISRSTIEELKAENNKQQTPYQFAYSFDVNIDLKKSALKDSIDCGFLYRLALKSQGAYSINVIFSEYEVPHGAKLFMYNEMYDHVIGAFTSNNNDESKVFAVSPVAGEKIILEYFEPYFADFRGSLIINRVSHDFLDILNTEKNGSRLLDCHVDINCLPEEDQWRKTAKRVVCNIIYSGNSTCSGALINNTDNDGRAYFLTANHCISTQSVANGAIFYFNYEKPGCSSGSGSLSQSVGGANLRATNNGSDFTLLEFKKIPISTFRPYFAGWDRNTTQNAFVVGIHHPLGKEKKISVFNGTPIQDACNPTITAGWKILWSSGTAEAGSSGSPLFNSNQRIIGQLSTGNSSCGDERRTCYGRFDVSWNGGGTSATRLRDWLDPSNSVFVLNGIDACPTGTAVNLNLNNTISSGTYRATNKIESTSTIQSGSIVTYSAGNEIILNPGFNTQAGSQFEAKIENYNCVIVPDPINLAEWTTLACKGGIGLQYNITNATNYTVKIYKRSNGASVYSGSGTISGNPVTVWSGTGTDVVDHIADVTFSSPGQTISNQYYIYVRNCRGNIPAIVEENMENLSPIQETGSDKLDFIVFPNPNDGIFTIELLEAREMKPYSVQIFSSSGALISKIEHCNANQINFNHTGLPSGVYYVKLSMGINTVTKKVIIQ